MEMYVTKEDGTQIKVSVSDFVSDIIDQIAENTDMDLNIENKDILTYAKKFIEEHDKKSYTREEYFAVLDEARGILEAFSQLDPYTFNKLFLTDIIE